MSDYILLIPVGLCVIVILTGLWFFVDTLLYKPGRDD